MIRMYAIIFFILTSNAVFSQAARTFQYSGTLNNEPGKNAHISIRLSILTGNETGPVIYTEYHTALTDSNGIYHIEIGRGKVSYGIFDSIIWSYGAYYLRTETDPLGGDNYTFIRNILMRIPTELSNDNLEGTVAADSTPGWGSVNIINTRNRRPKKITVDLTTSYANVSYPANTYPVYRHYEWADEDRDGIGNSFSLSYSEHTTNAFVEHTAVLGEVKLYPVAFQHLDVNSTNSSIVISISKPVAVTSLSETYAIKGPWKIIYFIEW